MTPTSASSPWSNFTRDPKALYIGIKVLNSTVTGKWPKGGMCTLPWQQRWGDHRSCALTGWTAAATRAGSDEECAVLCNDNQACEFFGWCPTNMTSG